ncbi:MAG: hypothetical protein WC551_08665 [Patescibacteria group bacterium]
MNTTIEIVCSKCGAKLGEIIVGAISALIVKVPPCRDCLAETSRNSYEDGRDDGYDAGYADAQSDVERS